MRILVTGASGHVGGAIASHLAAIGFDVFGLSRRSVFGLSGHVATDLADPDLVTAVRAVVPRCDAIVHAGASMDKRPTAVELSRVNAVGTHQMLALAAELGVTRFVYVSSVPVIGRPITHPVTEDHPTDPPTVYHASKLYGEYLVRLAAGEGLAAATLRLPSPIGPGTPRNRITSVFIERASAGLPLEVAGSGRRQQNYVDVRDVARAVAAAATRAARGLFLVPGTTISNIDLARLCVRLFGSGSEVRFTGRPDSEENDVWDLSGEHTFATLGYRPEVPLDESLRQMAAG